VTALPLVLAMTANGTGQKVSALQQLQQDVLIA
jgi:hypothetical protein